MSGIDPQDRPADVPPATPEVVIVPPISPFPAPEHVPPLGEPAVRPGFAFFRLHPNFWWGVLWCVALLMCTQVPAGLIAAVLLIVFSFSRLTEAGDLGDPMALLADPVVQAIFGLALALAHVLIITFSLIVLRLVIGRQWRREVALRLPSLWHLLLVLAVTPAFIILAQASYVALNKGLGVPSLMDREASLGKSIAFVLAVVAGLGVSGVVYLALWLAAGDRWAGPMTGRPRPYQVLVSVLFLACFFGAAVGVYHLLLPGAVSLFPAGPKSEGAENMEKLFENWPLVLGILVIGVLPGVGEELWCRAFLGRGIVGSHGYFWGVLLTSFLFGAIHLDPCQGTMAMIVGVVLHYVYLTTRSLPMPMLLHFLNNSLAVGLSRVPALRRMEDGADGVPWALLAGAGVLLAVVCAVLYRSRARPVARDGGPAFEPAFPGVALPPEGSGTAVETPRPLPAEVVLVLLALAAFAGGVGLTLLA